MGARSTGSVARGGKPKKKSKFSALEKMERARVGAGIKRRKGTSTAYGSQFLYTKAGGRFDRLTRKNVGRKEVAQVRSRYKRNPLPRANRSR